MESSNSKEHLAEDNISGSGEDHSPTSEDSYDDEQLHVALAHSLWVRYNDTGDEDLLAKMIYVEREILKMRPPGHPNRATTCGNLALSLKEQFNILGGDDEIREAVHLEREALALRPLAHPDHAMSCGNLAASLSTLYGRVGDIALIAEAVGLGRKTLSLLPVDGPERAMYCGNLAASLGILFTQNGDDSLLDDVIVLEREALSLRPLGHPKRQISCGNLAQSLMTKYHFCDGNKDLITEAIHLHREALALSPKGHQTRAMACTNLANTLEIRYDQIGGDDFLNEAVDLHREALFLSPIGHPYRAMYCGNLAASFERLHNRIGKDELLEEAIQLHRHSLSLRPVGHPNHANACSNLAIALTSLYSSTGDPHILLETLELHREAVASRLPGHPDRIIICRNLAESLMEYNHHVHDSKNLDEALALLLEVIQLAPPHKSWLHQCSLSKLYLEPSSSFHDVHKAVQHLDRSLDHEVDDPASAVRTILLCLERLWQVIKHDDSDHHLSLNAIYKRLVPLLPLLINPALGIQSQLQRLIGRGQVGSDAFVNAILGDHKTYPMGLELLEIVVCVFWSQRMYRRDPPLQQVPNELATKLEEILIVLSSKPTVAGEKWLTAQDSLYNASTRLYSLVREIRALPGLDRFMLGESYEALLSLASVSHPIVVLVGTRGLFYALIITSSRPEGNPLLTLNCTQTDLERSFRYHGSQRSHRGLRLNKPSLPLNRHLEYLWLNIAKPVINELGLESADGWSKPRLHWCPTGIFSPLPLHAAGIYDGRQDQRTCCADYVVSSYIPTLTSLLRLRKTAAPLARNTLNFMLVAEARAYDPHLQAIPGVEDELSCIATVAGLKDVHISHQQVGSTTILGTSGAMREANLVHLACHGVQDNEDATQSGFCLGDGQLTIARLMDLHLKNGFLAFLSACETATGSKEQPDQALHVAAAMLFAGFKNVIATMWAIADTDGPIVAKWFYEEVFNYEVIDADVVAYALDSAVRKLRGLGVPPDRWVPFIHMGS